MVLKASLGSYSERHIEQVLSLGFNKRPLSPRRVLGYISIVAPSSPITRGMGCREILVGRSVIGGRWRRLLTLNLPQMKHESPIKHRSPGTPTPMIKPYLALLGIPVGYGICQVNLCLELLTNQKINRELSLLIFSLIRIEWT